jgi:AcrR family transcriptional regulator
VDYATGDGKVMQNSDDLRVRRTRLLLQKALIELTIERGFVDVTVSDISERAMVNRSTFYRHYQDKYDLMSQYIEEVITLIQVENGDPAPVNIQHHSSAGIIRILHHVQDHADFYRVMLGKKGDPALCVQSFRQFIDKQMQHMLPMESTLPGSGRPPVGLSVNYILHAGIGAILWWLENEQPCTPEQLAGWLNQFSKADLNVALGSSASA